MGAKRADWFKSLQQAPDRLHALMRAKKEANRDALVHLLVVYPSTCINLYELPFVQDGKNPLSMSTFCKGAGRRVVNKGEQVVSKNQTSCSRLQSVKVYC